MGAGQTIDFSKAEYIGKLKEFSWIRNSSGCWKEIDYKNPDLVSQFRGQAVDDYRHNLKTVPITDVLNQYGKLLQTIRRESIWRGWTEPGLMRLASQIKKFKIKVKNDFESFHRSCVRASIWHSLNDLVNALKHLGSIEYLFTDLFESSHERFKESYKKTSRIWRTAMEEVVSKDAV